MVQRLEYNFLAPLEQPRVNGTKAFLMSSFDSQGKLDQQRGPHIGSHR